MGNKIYFNFEMIKKVSEINPYQFITGNNSYIIFRNNDGFVYIYDIQSKNTIKTDSQSSIIKMHPKYENVFILAENNTAKVYEIIQNSQEYKERTKVTGYNQPILLVEFSKYDDKIFGTYSNDRTLKIWNIDRAFCLCNILLTCKISNFQFYNESIFYFNSSNLCVTEYNYKTLEELYYKDIKYENFIVINNNQIIAFDRNILISYSDGKELRSLKLKHWPKEKYFQEKYNYLFLISLYGINVLDIKNLTVIFEKEIFNSEIIYIKNSLENKVMLSNLMIINENIEYYYLGPKTNFNEIKINKPIIPQKNFWEKTIPSISGIENLEWKANVKETITYKKYLDNPILESDIKLNYEKKLIDKKEEVAHEIKTNKKLDSDYIQLLKLIIKDNTNKDLVNKYLQILKKEKENKIKIDFDGKESFDDEYEKYKNMFTIEELKSYELPNKTISQKESFLSLLNDILGKKESDILSFKKTVKEELEKFQLFNQPIDFENRELYWYRNKLIIYFALDRIIIVDENNSKNNNNKTINNKENYERFKLMQMSIKEIMDRKILENDSIINDKILLTSLMMIIAIPLPQNLLEFNLNLIESKIHNLKHNEGNLLSSDIEQKIQTVKNDPSICLSNMELNLNKKLKLNDIELKTYDYMKETFNEIIDFEKMYKFLSKIISSRVFREAFEILYPEYFIFPFKDENDAKLFLDKYLHFIPFKSKRTAAITEKFSLEIYILLKIRVINITYDFNEEINNLIEKILYRGSCVVNCSHEMNHDFYNIFLEHSNGTIPLETPRKQYVEEREGGKNMEKLLFDQRIQKISLIQSIYLLNEKNYQKSLNEFREGFNQLKYEDLKMDSDCIFYELNGILYQNNFNYFSRTTNISFDEGSDNSNFLKDSYIGDIKSENDILGFLRDPL